MTMFFVVWVASALAAWGVIAVGLASHSTEMRRREEGQPARLLLGRWFVLPGIAFGIVAFALPLLAVVQGLELLEATNPDLSLPEWFFWVLAFALIGGLLLAIVLGVTAAPRIFAQRMLVVTPNALELRNRFTRRVLARIQTDQAFERDIENYAIQSGGANAVVTYTHVEEIMLSQGGESMRLQVKGDTNTMAAPMLPPRAAPNRIHYERDVKHFKAHRATWPE